MRYVWALLGAVLVSACSSSSSSDGPCAIRKGVYTMSWQTRGGDCGDLSESVINVDQPDDAPGKTVQADAPCSGSIVNSADNCIATMDQTCPVNGQPGSTKTTGKVTFSDDGAGGSGIVGIQLYDGAGALVCNGSYNLTFTRQ